MYPVYTILDIFRLCYISSHSIGYKLVYIDPFLANVPNTRMRTCLENFIFSSMLLHETR